MWYERETGTLAVVASLGDWSPDGARLAPSHNSDWLAVSAPGGSVLLFQTEGSNTDRWTRLPGDYTGDVTVTVDTGASARAFYRVREL